MKKNKFKYSGMELDFFEKAINWKKYYLKLSYKFFKKKSDFLEVGAGIGGLSKIFMPSVNYSSWTIIEPDQSNFKKLKANIDIINNNRINALNIRIDDFKEDKNKFDLILIADVLEHLENDKDTLGDLFNKLKPKGKIIIFVPACKFLFSEFDKQIGHFRRYSFKSLKEILPIKSKIIDIKYIDSIGFFASLFNKLFLKSNNPSIRQVLFWDRILIPLSRIFDRLLFYKFGKNIFLIISN